MHRPLRLARAALALATLAGSASACTTEEASSCQEAADKVAACLGEDPIEVATCDEDQARTILTHDCAAIREGKGDLSWLWCWTGYGCSEPPPAACVPSGEAAAFYAGQDASEVSGSLRVHSDGNAWLDIPKDVIFEFTPIDYPVEAERFRQAIDSDGRYRAELSHQPHAITIFWNGQCFSSTVYPGGATRPVRYDWMIEQQPDGRYELLRR